MTPVEYLSRLSVRFRIDFKVLLIVYKAFNDLTPSYNTDLLIPYFIPRSLRPPHAKLEG